MKNSFFTLFFFLAPCFGFAAETLTGAHIKIAWFAPESFGTETETIGIQFQIDPHWHIYWINPGDSGAAPKFNFGPDCAPAPDSPKLLCPGVEVGPIQWPYPQRIPLSTLVNFGYEKNVAYPFEIRPSADATKIRLEIKLEWLVCQEECIPGFGTLTLDRPIKGWKTEWKTTVSQNLQEQIRKVPQVFIISDQESANANAVGAANSAGTAATKGTGVGFSTAPFPWHIVSAKATDTELKLSLNRAANFLDSESSAKTSSAKTAKSKAVKIQKKESQDIFPVNGDFLKPQAPRVVATQDGFDFYFLRSPGSVTPTQTSFVFVEDGKAWEVKTSVDASNVTLLVANTSSALKEQKPLTENRSSETDVSFWLLIVSAFFGGLILNLMPCVLPVLSIKFISMTRTGEKNRWREALLYTAGVLVTFAALGALFLLLRSAGHAVGWGFQLQSPVVVLSLILLFWLMALNFLGVFELGNQIMNWAGRHHQAGSFMTGVLSVFVAAPCTGPFMGSALGAAATLPALPAMALFLFLGLGLAFPFLLMAAFPGLFQKIPRPGAWMETMKQFFAFPLFATVLWLLWVLGVQTGTSGWLISGFLLLTTSFALWCGRSNKSLVRTCAWAIGFVGFIWSIQSVQKASVAFAFDSPAQAVASNSQWVPYDPIRIEIARNAGQPVFVDFTAAWCITCQVNKKVVLETTAALEIFKKNKVLLMRADWTRQDPLITHALAKLGRSSVPVYVFYGKSESAPRLLPQILRLSMIEELFNPQPKEKQ